MVAVAAFIFYLPTLAYSLTLNNFLLVAKLNGEDSGPWLGHPLLWLVTLPMRGLPAGGVAFGLNCFSALCAAGSLGLLFRSVLLLPQNRLPFQRFFLNDPKGLFHRSDNWIPAAVAVVACGLEFNYWQQATTSAGETLDLLLLASAIWLLLEYRIQPNQRWLKAAAFVWGLGLAENWAMQITFPLFVIAVIWLCGLAFFDKKFILRMLSLGFAGFSVYAIIPLANSWLPHAPLEFGEAWLASLKLTKQTLMSFYSGFISSRRDMGALVLVYFLTPILPLLIRVPDEGANHRTLAASLQITLFHFTSLALLLGCLWIALDPQIGPRQIILKQFNASLPLLSFDYLTAMCAGYFAGYFLLIYGDKFEKFANLPPILHPPFTPVWARKLVPVMVSLLPLIVALVLLYKNYPAISRVNRQPLIGYGKLAARSLPPGSGIILADDQIRLLVFESALTADEKKHWQTVDSSKLASHKYRDTLEKKSPHGWSANSNQSDLQPHQIAELLNQLSHTNRILYLHPSFGSYFESFYLQPLGSLYELKRFDDSPEGKINPPLLDPQQISLQEKFWDEAFAKEIEPITQVFQGHPANWPDKFFTKLKTTAPRENQSLLIGEWYSMALNDWGVRLQRQNLLQAAQKRFEQAAAAATNNLATKFNLNCNANLQDGKPMDLGGVATLAGQFRNLKQMDQLLVRYGPIDDPVFCYLLGTVYAQSSLFRQAIQELERAKTLAPGASASSFALAQIYSRCRLDTQLFATVREIRQATKNTPLAAASEVELAVLEARAWLSQTNFPKAKNLLESVLEKHPGNERVLELMMQAYLAFGDYTNALQLVSSQAAAQPDSIPALMNQSVILLMMNQPSNALPVLNHVLTLTNSPKMRINRAAAYLKLGNFNAAESDYQQLTNFTEGTFQIHFGLSQIALERHQTNLAIEHLQICLSNSVSGSDVWEQAQNLLNGLKNGK
jgi:tetratricopeptide (TPR) repeat protein